MNQRPVTICFANNKGGSGKSTTCANVGYSLAAMGYRVLLLDGDMQMNLALSFFPEDTVLSYAQSEKNLYHAVSRRKGFPPAHRSGQIPPEYTGYADPSFPC